MAAFVGEFVSLPRRKPDPPRGYCELCGCKVLMSKLRPAGRDEFGPLYRCEPCDTDNGDDWHGNERWINR
jgi:hypothetical protein